MRLCVGIVCAILISGGAYSASGQYVTEVSLDAGLNYRINGLTFTSNIDACYLKPPHDGDVIKFTPGLEEIIQEKYEIHLGTDMFKCAVTILNVDEMDSGIWEIYYENSGGSSSPELYNLLVNPKDTESIVAEDHITWLTGINHFTRTGEKLDITLSKISHDEECYIRTSNNEIVNIGDITTEGVTAQSSSDFVSCRITIGPMVEELLGNWTLCGKYNDNEEHERCQQVSIEWSNNNNPSSYWDSRTEPRFNHPVNYGMTLNPGVRGIGNVITCHVITPAGEDLVITPGSTYPNIERVGTNDFSLCSVIIGPIDENLLGNWVVYAIFRTSFTTSEVRQPLLLSLYDNNNPYEQAYNVTVVTARNHVVNMGTNITAEVSGTGVRNSCEFTAPSGQTYKLDSPTIMEGVSFVDAEQSIACRISIGPITEGMLGNWQIIGKFNENELYSEKQHSFSIIKEDPTNPFDDTEREIINIEGQRLETKVGERHTFTIGTSNLFTGESCHLITPDGLQFTIMEGFAVPGVEVIKDSGVECGVVINISSEDIVGDWTLISRGLLNSVPTERRLPFTIYVEENVDAFPEQITISEGNDLYIRLKDAIDFKDSCQLNGPESDGSTPFEIDISYSNYCGYIVKNVNVADTGKWEISYGDKIVYKATIDVMVYARKEVEETSFVWVKDRAVEELIGPEDAIYCKIESPDGLVMYDGFGRCEIIINRVTMEHRGTWKMYIGTPGRVLLEEHDIYIEVKEAEAKALVSTHVEKSSESVLLSCSIPSQFNVNTCKFRDPSGEILLAYHGVGEDRYIYHGMGVSYASDASTHGCGIRIINPTSNDIGLWRCAVETEEEVYYGFLDVGALQDATVTEPTLTAEMESVTRLEGDTVSISCSVQAPIRYCYFRSQNGTIFNVGPGMSSENLEYVGAGLDAGECGVRFNNMLVSDSGRWSCHVGFLDTAKVEQRANILVTVQEAMIVNHYWSGEQKMILEAYVSEGRSLEYCRFVRIDGLGFTTENVPEGYESNSYLSIGHCHLHAKNPTVLDLHPWTVVAKIQGQDMEISKVTTQDLLQSLGGYNRVNHMAYMWFMVMFSSLMILFIGVSIGPKKNRKWTYARAAQVRNSIRSSFRKKQPVSTETV